jgi:hypothetical protein
MIEFKDKKDILPLSKRYDKIGNFELDILAIKRLNNEIVMIDHDSPNFEMGRCAKDLQSFLLALANYDNFMLACQENESLYNDKDSMEAVAIKSSELAGNKDYLWFYMIMFGI